MRETDEILYSRFLREGQEGDLRILLERHREGLTLFLYGYDDGRFAPQDNATRAQIAAVIVRYIESVLSE
ncbi:MAG: S-layer homology domain-containing protein [Firmicutes bacterium]|nr:S-layer homology domain-containing protein [Bacillota bacterium]